MEQQITQRAYGTAEQFLAVLVGSCKPVEEGMHHAFPAAEVELYASNGGSWIAIAHDGFRLVLASTRKPSEPRYFKTVDACLNTLREINAKAKDLAGGPLCYHVNLVI